MSKFFEALSPIHQTFIAAQPMFFIATAPASGRINLSPKGMDTFRCLSATRVGYLDLTGSGNETAAHVLENGRVTVMFCSFGPNPLILRIYGDGDVIAPDHPEWDELLERFPPTKGVRQIMTIAVTSVQTSCGYAVPEMTLVAERTRLTRWAEKKGDAALAAYRANNNQRSIDGRVIYPIEDGEPTL